MDGTTLNSFLDTQQHPALHDEVGGIEDKVVEGSFQQT
jgi:hypothetical protein